MLGLVNGGHTRHVCTVGSTDLMRLGLVYGGHSSHVCTLGFTDLMTCAGLQ